MVSTQPTPYSLLLLPKAGWLPLLLRMNDGGRLGWHPGGLHGELPSPNQMVRSSPLGVSFPHPSKVTQLFLLAQCFCFLAKPVLVIGLCWYVNGFTVLQQLGSSKHLPHTWQK